LSQYIQAGEGGARVIGRPRANRELDTRVAEHALELFSRKRLRMPITGGYMQEYVLRVLGHKIGQNRAAEMVRHLRRTGKITQVSRYKGKHGFWVPIFRINVRASQDASSVLRKSAVKQLPWWQHGLFGNPGGCPPRDSTRKQRKRWGSGLFRAYEREREAVWNG
jgi:hypothetical protein